MSKPLTIDNPPTPTAWLVAEITTCDSDTYLYWRDGDGEGKRIGEIPWPDDWPEEVSGAFLRSRGFKVWER